MIQQLQRGQRLTLDGLTAQPQLTLRAHLPGMETADLSVFGLNESRQLTDDRYFIFYNQTASPEQAITLNPSEHSFQVDLVRLPLGIHRLVLVATTDEQPFSALRRGTASLMDERGDSVHFNVEGQMFQGERALILLEVYRHQGKWRVTGVGQGFSGGLQALLESMGGEVVGQEETPLPQPDHKASQTPDKSSTPLLAAWEPLQSAPPRPAADARACQNCGKRGSLFAPLKLNSEGLCRECAHKAQEALGRFRTRFLAACADGVIEHHEWQDLQQTVLREELDAKTALDFVRTDALRLLERTLTIAYSDGMISLQEESDFGELARLLRIPPGLLAPLQNELVDLRAATSIREGHLLAIQTTVLLDAGEVAHLEVPATFRHVTATRSRDIVGRMVVTNRQIYFIGGAGEGGWNVQYGKILRIEERSDGVNLELSVKKGSGTYHHVTKPLILSATLDALVRLHKRLLLMPQTERASRSIPQNVKIAVWQRDQGKCVECGDNNYLEYDHVIPHSLGGASTENNLQLLCRRCNLQKSNKI
ncbi:TerD family protein [Deinococcus marmoris]|uniref:Tellurium resistance protein TerA n=1 Tax=Deinococcus marmoris TaxID=249408 RepID=A0A1U7P2C2_9DEIO|nr:TerD family protein [Deinococcus marmoris]OLV19335.1 Tellurium resistance protein TerA [Deinococcus marmoris]